MTTIILAAAEIVKAHWDHGKASKEEIMALEGGMAGRRPSERLIKNRQIEYWRRYSAARIRGTLWAGNTVPASITAAIGTLVVSQSLGGDRGDLMYYNGASWVKLA
jgi:hypothetical protein